MAGHTTLVKELREKTGAGILAHIRTQREESEKPETMAMVDVQTARSGPRNVEAVPTS